MYAPVAVEGQLSFYAQPDDIGVVPGGSGQVANVDSGGIPAGDCVALGWLSGPDVGVCASARTGDGCRAPSLRATVTRLALGPHLSDGHWHNGRDGWTVPQEPKSGSPVNRLLQLRFLRYLL